MADGMNHDFLTEPLLSLRGSDGVLAELSLPQVLHRLATGEIAAFTALRRHQRQAWYCFLAQLGAMVLHRERLEAECLPATTAMDWLEWLRNMTHGQAEPWCLLVDDLSKAAIFQPPVPDAGFLRAPGEKDPKPWHVDWTPHALDVLDTARDHDVKVNVLANPQPEHWLFALCVLQTTVGNLSGNYKSVARLGSPDGDRPMAGFIPDRTWARRWCRDVHVALQRRERMAATTQALGTIELLWLEDWPRESRTRKAEKGAEPCDRPTSWTRLDPYCVEVARRVRMTTIGTTLVCRTTTMNLPRVERPQDESQGVGLGDIWLPLERIEVDPKKKGAEKVVALQRWGVRNRGIGYDQVVALLFSRPSGPGPLHCQSVDGDTGLYVAVHARKKHCVSAGLHERWVPIPPHRRNRFRDMTPDDPLAVRARELVKDAGTAQDDVLDPALRVLLAGGKSPGDQDRRERDALRERLRHQLAAFDRAVDDRFFDLLGWEAQGDDLDAARQAWRQRLYEQCERHLALAAQSLPVAGLRRERAVAAAFGVLEGASRRVGLVPAGADPEPGEHAATEVA